MRTPVHTANGRRDLALPGVAQAIESTRGQEGCDVTLPEGVWPGGTRRRRCLSWPIALASGILALMTGGVLVDRMMEWRLATELPDVPPISIVNAFASASDSSVKAPAQAATVTGNDVARRAYDLYLARGRVPGHDVDDWLQAEREFRSASLRWD